MAGERLLLQLLLEAVELALRLRGLELAVAHRHHAGRVVAAVLQPAQAVDQQGHHLACPRSPRFRTCSGSSRFPAAQPPAQPSRFFCRTRPTARAPSGTSLVITDPAAVCPPHLTGATSMVSLPMKAPGRSRSGACGAVVVAGTTRRRRWPLAHRGVPQYARWLPCSPASRSLHLDEVAYPAPEQAGCRRSRAKADPAASRPRRRRARCRARRDAVAERLSRSQAPWWSVQPAPTTVRPRRDTPGWMTVSRPTRTPGSTVVRSGSRMVTPESISSSRWRSISTAVDAGELAPVVDAEGLARGRRGGRGGPGGRRAWRGHGVGEVELPLGVVGA